MVSIASDYRSNPLPASATAYMVSVAGPSRSNPLPASATSYMVSIASDYRSNPLPASATQYIRKIHQKSRTFVNFEVICPLLRSKHKVWVVAQQIIII